MQIRCYQKYQQNYIKKNVLFLEKEKTSGTWKTQLGMEIGENIPSYVIIGFIENDKFDSQRQDNSVFHWLPVSTAVCRLSS